MTVSGFYTRILFLLILVSLPLPVHAWKMESGTIDLPATSGQNGLFSFSFKQVYSAPPVVVALPTSDGFHSSALRIDNVTTTGFQMAQVEEFSWDGPHASMTVSYIAVEPGSHTLPDGTAIEAGLLSSRPLVGDDYVQFNGRGATSWGSHNFTSGFVGQPAVIGAIQTLNNETNAVPDDVSNPWLTTVFQSVSAGGFDYALERSEVYDRRAGNSSNYFFDPLDEAETVGYIAFDSKNNASFTTIGNVNILFEARIDTQAVRGWDDGCRNLDFTSSFGNTPVALASKVGRRDDDGGWLRQCSLSGDSLGLVIDQDQAQDSERSHQGDDVSLIAFSDAFIFDSEIKPPEPEPLMLESRSVTIPGGQSTTVTFDQVYPSPPAVFVLSDDNNPEPSSVRVRNITEQGFEVFPAEPPLAPVYPPRADQPTTIHYLAVTYGQHRFPDGTRMEVGQLPLQTDPLLNVLDPNWTRLNFLTSFSSTPAVISHLQTAANELYAPAGRSDPWFTVAQDQLGPTGVDIALERAEAVGISISSPEIAAYLAVEQGVISDFVDNDGQTISAEAQVTADQIRGTVSCDSVSFLQLYPGPPRVIGSQATRDGGDGGWLRRCSVSTASVDLKIEEDWAIDQDLSHTTERASFLAFSQDFAADFSLRAVYALEGPTWDGTPGEVKELRGTGLDGRSVSGARSEPAQVCYGATLSGGAFVDVPHDPELSVSDEFTLMAWINTAALPTGAGYKTIVSKDENYEFHLNSSGELYWWWTVDGGGSRSFTSGSSLPLNTWVHTAIIYSRRDGVQRMVIDGVEQARATFTGESLQLTTDPFQIGADQGFAGREFEGQIDEVRLYGRALSDAAILREANRTRPCAQVLDHFRVTVAATASVCAPVDVQIQAEDAGDNLLTGYQGMIGLSTSSDHGDWQRVSASGALLPLPDTDDDGQATYQFDTADNGAITLGLANSRADRLTIHVRDTSGGQFGASEVVEFSENALVISLTDSFGSDLIAGRPHELQAEVLRRDPISNECGRVEAFDGPIDLRAWLTRQSSDPGSAAPELSAGAGSTTLLSARPAATNLTFDFNQGLAELRLDATDVGYYALELEDSETGLILDENNAPLTLAGTSSALTVRPFGLAVTVPGNPAGNTSGGAAFQAAGRPFDVQVRAVRYENADDVNNDGQPDDHSDGVATNNANLVDNATVDGFDTAVTVDGYLAAGPAGASDPGLAGLSSLSGFSNGSVTGSASYNEVGVIEVAVDFSGAYLGRTITLVGDSGPVGRFYPEQFSLENQMDGVLENLCGGFNYTGQGFGYDIPPNFSLAARAYDANGTGPITQNYREGWQKLSVTDFSRNDPVSDLSQVGTQGTLLEVMTTADMPSLVSNGNGTMIYEAGADEFVYTRDANARIAPFNAELEMELTGIVDSDGVAMPASELPALQSTGTSIRYGRLVLENAYGPETMDLRVPFEVQIWNGTRFERHADENCWVYSTADAVITDTPPNTVVDGATGMLAGGAPQSGSEIVLSAPGEGNTGSIRVRYPVPGYWQDDFDGNGSKEDPTAIATFGVYRGNDRVIYWGER